MTNCWTARVALGIWPNPGKGNYAHAPILARPILDPGSMHMPSWPRYPDHPLPKNSGSEIVVPILARYRKIPV
eukprot:5385383-Pyramimonas_sp.AAC.1